MTSTFSTARYFRRLFSRNATITNRPLRRGMTSQSHLNRAVVESLENRLLMTALPATHLVFSTGPTNTVAGDPIASIVVSVEDSSNSVVLGDTSSVTLAVNTGPGSTAGTLFFAVQANNGVATISGLSLTQAGSYTLSATDGALTPAISSSFAITPDAASQLVFTTQPANSTAGITLPSTSVSVEDQYGNVVTSDTSTVTLAVSGNATLGGTVSANASSGVATFTNLSMTQSGSYQLSATDSALAAGSSASFNVTPAAATHLAFTTQPSSTTAGSTISSVAVSVEDQYGNVVTSSSANVTISVASGNGSLAGTLTAASVNGVATFSGLSINTADAYTLSVSTGGLTGATSSSFNITPAAASRVIFTQQPASASAGALANVTVSVQDQYGNVVTSNSSNVTVALASGNGTLLGTVTVAASSGVATFSTLAMHTPGTFTLSATDGSLTSATSSSFAITPAAASQLVFTTQPVNIAAGALPSVSVAVEDQYGNVVTSDNSNVTIAFASGAGTLGGTLTVAAVNGVAAFTDLSVHTPNTFTLGATDGSLSNATSSSFVVTPAAATKLVFSQQPGNITAGALGTVTVTVEDQYNNVVSTDSSNITLSINSGTGTLGGTTTVTAVNGVATFSSVSLHNSGNFTLLAHDGGLVNAVSSSFAVNPAAASQLVFTSVPSSTVAGSGTFATSVAIEDQYGNIVTSSSANVGLAVTTGGSTFNLVVAASSGVATFSGITLVHAGPGSMRATSSGLPAVNNTSFAVTPAAASQVVFTATPSSGIAGATLSTVTAAIEDQYGNVVTTDASTVTLGDSGPGPFSGTNSVAAVNGVATFSNVSLRTAGSYSLFTLDGSLTQASSGSFTVAPAAASHLVFTTNTAGGVAGATLSNVVVKVEDQYNNVVSTDTSSITLSMSGSNVSLGGTLTVAAVNGVATFTDLAVTKTGTYQISAADGLLTNGTSSNMTITPAAATHLAFIAAPTNVAAGSLGTITVAVEDQYNNVVTSNTSNVTMSLGVPGTLFGTQTVAAVAGVATFSDLEIHDASNFDLQASDGGLTGVTSSFFAVTAADASRVRIISQPTNTTAGQTISNVVARVEDQYGNVVTTDSSNVTIAIASGNGTLGGTTTVAAVNGVATFSTLSMTKAGAFSFTVSDGSLSNATSSSFNITPDAIEQVAFQTGPVTTVAGHTLTSVVVEVEDQFGNVVATDSGSEIDLAIATGNGTLLGTLAVNDVNGIATFSDLSIQTAGSYTLNASGGAGVGGLNGIVDADSSSFDITPDVASKVAVTTQPTTTTAGQTISTVTVAVEDQYGNVVTTDTSNVTLASHTGNGTITGTATVAAVNGVASFTNLATTTTGSYALKFTDGSLANTTSSNFSVTADVASQIKITSQPTDTVAGHTISTVTVAVEDQYGNVVTTDTSSVTLEAMMSTLNGNTTVAAVNGIATFANLSINESGGTFLFAEDGNLNGDVSSSFTIDHDVATKLVEVDGFGGSYSADGLGAMFIVAEDQYGNQVVDYNSNVTLSIASGNGTLLGTTTTNSNGSAAFVGMMIHEAGTYTLRASNGVLTDWVSGSFTVTAAAASKVVITTQPADTTAGGLGNVTVTVEDQYGNTVATDSSNVTLALNSNGTLGGTLTVATSNGVAAFSDLSLHTVGTYSLNASDGLLTADNSNFFDITPAAAAQLAYSVIPGSSTAGGLSTVVVDVEDQYGNVVTTDSSNVTLSLASGPGSLGGTVTVAAVNGVATFSTLSLHTAGDYTISAADGSLSGTTSDPITITPTAVDHVAFVSQPSTTIAGALGNVTVAVEDQYNNIVTTDSSNVTVSLASGNATLLGTLTVAANNGVATFSTLGLHKVGTYTLGAADGSLVTDISSSFAITPAASTQLLFTTQPSGGTAGNTLASVAVTIEDQYGNTATGDNSVVTLLCNAGVNSFTLNLAAVNGVATFSGFSVTKAGTFTFGATDGSLTGATSSNFTIAPQAATHLAFTTSPANVATGALGTVTVAVEDQYNNIVTSDSSTITLALASGNGTLGGTLAVQAVNGVATFSDLYLHTPGNFSIAATDGSLTLATTGSFAVTPGVATQLLITQQPVDSAPGTLGTITLTLKDQYGNVCTNDSSSVTAAVVSGLSTVGGTTTVNAVNGVATFSNLSITTASGYRLIFTDGSLTSAVSNQFIINHAAASKLFIVSSPANMTAGNVSTLTVAVFDQFNNPISDDTSAVTIAVGSGNGTLGGTLTVNAVNGIATFSDLSLHTAGTYTLAYSDGSLTGATTSSFTVSAAAADHLAYATAPGSNTAGQLNTVRVYVKDQYDNTVTTDSSAVTVSLASGPGSLTGVATANAVNGVATFSNLNIHTVGNYTMAAADGSLTGVTSGSFNITPAVGSHLAVITGPSDTEAGALGTISIALEDQYNNIVTSSSANMTITLASGNGNLSGTSTVAAANGTATFTTLTITKAGTYTLAATSGVFTVTTGSFTISPASLTQLVFITPPANTANFNLNSISVAEEDQYGNIETGDTSSIVITIQSGNATLGGTTTMAAVNGVATFPNLTIAKSGAYTLNALVFGGSTSVTSNSFNVAAKLAIASQPTTNAAGVLSPITVQIQDNLGNLLSSDNSNITLAFTSGPSATIGGTLTVQAVNGVATFSDLALHTPGVYTFTVTDGVIASATTANITITPAAASQIVITSGPANMAAGALSTLTAKVEDQYGNVVTGNNSNVTVSLNGNGTLGGTTTVSAVNGVATFSNLSLHTAGSYSLTFSQGSLTSATSGSFSVGAAAANKVVVLTQTGNLTAGQSGVFTVALEDQYGNIVSTTPTTITASVGSGNGTLGGTLTANTTNGIATFSNLTLTKSGSYTLSFTGTSLTAGATSAFTIAPTASTHLLITHEPSATTAGGSNLLTVAVEDQYGNVVTTDTSAVTVALASGNGTLGGTLTVNAVNGVASFSQFTLTKTGTYSMTVSDGSLNSAISTNFAITPAAATHLVFATQPTNTSTSAIGTVSVLVEDQYGNLATDNASNVTLAVGTGAGSLSGTTTAAVQNGVATFTNLTLSSSGFFTLTASDAALTTATSNGFSVAAKLAITNQPSTSAAGALPAITVALEDSAGNILTADNSAVTLTIASGPAGSQILGTVTVNAVNGVATFSNAILPTVGTYTLTASQDSGTSANSTPITITPGAAAAVAFVTTPASATAGVKMGSFAVQVRDQYGNLVTAATKTQMTLTVATGAGSSINLKSKVVNGVATFSGGVLKAAGNYTFTANFGGITGASGAVTVAAAAPKNVTFTQQPANTTMGSPFSVAVRVVDAYGNLVSSSTPVTIALAKKGTLAGTLTAITTNGIALFANLSITTHGTYNLKATAAGKSATSSRFSVA